MAKTYSIQSLTGQYIREQHRIATESTVVKTLTAAMQYIGYPAPEIMQIDNGDWVAYRTEDEADADVGQGGSAGPVMLARADAEMESTGGLNDAS